jgi:predicted alpha/beta-hydrolase family hydrolase
MDNKRLSIPDIVLASVPRADELDALLTTIAELRRRLSHARCVLCGEELGDRESALTADEELAHSVCIIEDAAEGL